MLILFDNGTPAPLPYALKGHVIVEAIERGWDRLVNGELIAEAEASPRWKYLSSKAVFPVVEVLSSASRR
jgi:hypothetical protein